MSIHKIGMSFPITGLLSKCLPIQWYVKKGFFIQKAENLSLSDHGISSKKTSKWHVSKKFFHPKNMDNFIILQCLHQKGLKLLSQMVFFWKTFLQNVKPYFLTSLSSSTTCLAILSHSFFLKTSSSSAGFSAWSLASSTSTLNKVAQNY